MVVKKVYVIHLKIYSFGNEITKFSSFSANLLSSFLKVN